VRAGLLVVTLSLTAGVVFLVKGAYKPLAPEEDSGMFVDGQPAPETISGLKLDADAVVLVMYWGQHRTRPCPHAGIPCPVSSLYVLEIRDVLKSHPALSSGSRRFELELYGGVEELPGLVTPTFVHGRQDPVRGHRYVIFARRYGNRWVPASGNDGGSASMYDVTGDRAVSLSTQDWDNTSPPLTRAFLDELRRY